MKHVYRDWCDTNKSSDGGIGGPRGASIYCNACYSGSLRSPFHNCIPYRKSETIAYAHTTSTFGNDYRGDCDRSFQGSRTARRQLPRASDRQAFAKQKTTREGIFHLAPRLTVALVVVASSCSFHFFPSSVRRSAKMSAAPVPTGDGIGIANLPNQVRAHALPSFASCSPTRAHRGTKS